MMTLELMAIQTLRALSASVAALCTFSFRRRDSHNIESRVDAALGRSRLLECRIDNGQNRLGLLRSLDLTRGSFLLHCAKRGVSGLRFEARKHWTVMDQRTGCSGRRGNKEWKSEGSNKKFGLRGWDKF